MEGRRDSDSDWLRHVVSLILTYVCTYSFLYLNIS